MTDHEARAAGTVAGGDGWRSRYTGGEECPCGQQAAHKVEEVIFDDDPQPMRHPLAKYVCAGCFQAIMRGFPAEVPQARAAGVVEAGHGEAVEAVLRWLDAGDAWPRAFGSDGANYGERTTGNGEPVWRPANAGALMRAALAAATRRAEEAERERDEHAANENYLRGQIASLLSDAEVQANEREGIEHALAAATRQVVQLREALGRYAFHDHGCQRTEQGCSCGLDAARTPTAEQPNPMTPDDPPYPGRFPNMG